MDRGKIMLGASLQRFKSGLSQKETVDFESASLSDVRKDIILIQQDQDHLKTMMNLPRIQPFLDGMEHLEKSLRLFVDASEASEFMAYVWGPVRFLLKAANHVEQAFDNLLDAYQRLGIEMSELAEYEILFKESIESRVCLAGLYEDVLKFHRIAMNLFTGRIWRKIFKASWKDVEPTLKTLAASLNLHRRVIENQGYSIRTPTHSQFSSQSPPQSQSRTPILDKPLVADHVLRYEGHLYALWKDFEQEEADRKRKQKLEVIKWIAASSFTELFHNDYCKKRQICPNSGRWLFKQHDKVDHWIKEELPSHSVLWIHGKKGAGKTILSSLIVEECKRLMKGDKMPSDCKASYFYCQEGDPKHNTCLGVFKGILHQLVLENEDLLPSCYEKAGNSGQQILSNPETAKALLELFFESNPRQYVIIDGLDECKVSELRQVVQFFTSMVDRCDGYDPGKLRVLFMSLYQVEMKKLLDSANILDLKVRDNAKDIRDYVRKRLIDESTRFNLDDSQISSIQELITRRSEGMFLYAYLAMEYLLEQQTKKDLLEKVEENMMPSGLEETYERIIGQIKVRLERKSTRHWKKAVMLLGWLVCAKRPLKWHEIQAILAFEPDRGVMDFDMNMIREDITEICGSIVQVLPGNRVQLIHQTARKYVVENKYVHEKEVQCDLAILCLRYLSLRCFSSQYHESDRDPQARQGYFSFQDYAISRWSGHIETILEGNASVFSNQIYERAFDSALTDFTHVHHEGLKHIQHADLPADRCARFRQFAFHDKLFHVWSHIFSHQNSAYEVRNKVSIVSLDHALDSNRKVLEGLKPDMVAVGKDKLESYYGDKFYKCSRVLCDFFYEGFDSEKDRNHHHNRHDRPFQCPVEGCTQAPFGFSSNKDKERHVRLYHPEQSEHPAAFVQPSRRQENAKFPCTICGKSFTRNINLKGHTRSHFGERPFACSSCGKAFTRLNDCRRHEKIHTRRAA